MLDNLQGWRTVLVNLIAALLPLLQEFGLGSYIPDRFMVWYVLVLIALNLALRFMTSTPVGKKPVDDFTGGNV